MLVLALCSCDEYWVGMKCLGSRDDFLITVNLKIIAASDDVIMTAIWTLNFIADAMTKKLTSDSRMTK
jgi:hypothetical protein